MTFLSCCPLAQLAPEQAMLLWGFRLWVGDRGNWRLVTDRFQHHYGVAAGARAVRGLATVICALRQHASRPIRHYPDGAPLLSADEHCLTQGLLVLSRGGDPVRCCIDMLAPAGWGALRAGFGDLAAVLYPADLAFRGLAAAE